jgi:hypothetical protein
VCDPLISSTRRFYRSSDDMSGLTIVASSPSRCFMHSLLLTKVGLIDVGDCLLQFTQ